jgi:fluoride ion exporter CrcB/FEX
MAYFEQGNWGLFAANFLAHNLLCLGAVLVGMILARGI